MKKEYLTASPAQTKKIGKELAKRILKSKPRKEAFVIGLEGELGGGKTTFLQGFAKGLEIKEKILSPTFIIYRKSQIPMTNDQSSPKPQIPNFKSFYHIDCYRIKKPKELLDLGFKKIISNPKNIVAIEWAGRVKKIMPKNTIWIKFKFINKKERKITIGNSQFCVKMKIWQKTRNV